MLVQLLEAPMAGLQVDLEAAALHQGGHFDQRAAERGVTSLPGYVLLAVCEAALAARREDMIEKVWPICPASSCYRVLLPEGAFYPIWRGGRFRTIYSADEIRKARDERRRAKKSHGRRMRSGSWA